MKKDLSTKQQQKIEFITEHFQSSFSSKNPALLAESVPSGKKDFFYYRRNI